MIRRMLEKFTRGTSIRRRLPRRFGSRPVYLTGDSALSYLRPNWSASSESLLRAAKKYAGGMRSIWDIGANCGVFTFSAAHVAASGAEILSIEPDPFLAALLQRTVNDSRNSDLRVSVLCSAIGDRDGIARFLVAARGRSSSSLEVAGHRSQAGGTRYIQHVPTTSLDGLLAHFTKPDLIKIDVEGAEELVLNGALVGLETIRPLFYIEVGGRQKASVTSIFRRYGYRIYDGDRDDEVELSDCVFNTLAVPQESKRTNA